MKIVDKYILRQLIVGFMLILVSLTILVWLTQSLKMIDMIVTKGVSVGVFLEMSFLVMPKFLQILMPLALFAVTLFTFIRMQSDKELMVLKAVGMSGHQLMSPVLHMAGILTVAGYILGFWIIPWSNGQLREMRWKIQNNLSHLLLQEGQFNSLGKGKMIYVREQLPEGGGKGILVYEIDKGKKTVSVADTGKFLQTPEGIKIIFSQLVRLEYDPKMGRYSGSKAENATVDFPDQNRKADTRIKNAAELGVWHLLSAEQSKVSSVPVWRKYKVEAFKRFTMPLYNFVFALLALSAVLLGTYKRQGDSVRIYTVVGCALLVQTLELAFDNMAGKNLWFLILALGNICVPVLVVRSLFHREQKKKRIKKGLVLWLMIVFSAVSAQALPHIEADSLKKDQPIDFESDRLSFNQKTGIATLSGNVVLTQNGAKIRTDEIQYDKAQNIVHVPNEAFLTLADGTRAHTTQIHVFPKDKELITGAAEVDLIDGTHLSTDKIVEFNWQKHFFYLLFSYAIWFFSCKTIDCKFNSAIISHHYDIQPGIMLIYMFVRHCWTKVDF